MLTGKIKNLLTEFVQLSMKVNIRIYAIWLHYMSKYGIILGYYPNQKIENILLISEMHVLKTLIIKVFIHDSSWIYIENKIEKCDLFREQKIVI